MSDTVDVVIVGAGLMGSSAAYYAAKAGKRVLLLEQFRLLHGSGSSHGNSRIFRVAYPNAAYTALCLESLDLWREIEREGDAKLLELTGELDFASERNVDLAALEAALAQHSVAFETLTGAEANARFPGFSLDATNYAVFNKLAGVLNPHRAMATLQALAQKHGAVVRENSKVTGVFAADDADDLALVELADGSVVSARQCIVTSGAWTTSVLQNSPSRLQIQPIATYGTYWTPREAALYVPARFPVFINYESEWIYGLPMTDPSEGVKICRHDGPAVDPDARADVEQSDAHVAFLRAYCMYSMTADEHFILDLVAVPPRCASVSVSTSAPTTTKRVVVGAGFSGHGAKMTPVIGKILAELALEGKSSRDISLFRASRPEAILILLIPIPPFHTKTQKSITSKPQHHRVDPTTTTALSEVLGGLVRSAVVRVAGMQEVTVVNAATLVCLRVRPCGAAAGGELGWEVLLGQGEVKNWLRSSPKLTRLMRYPGEWKFPGGAVDAGDASLESAALRELQEEFLGLPAAASSARMHFLGEKITKAIRGRRHRMFNFVAFEDENLSWMGDDALRAVNATLAAKREAFEHTHLASGAFWRMASDAEKERVSPEIHRVQWFPIDAAMEMMRGALLAPRTPVDDWQRSEFERYGVAKRDPMYITYRVLLDVAEVTPPSALKELVQHNRAPSLEEVRARQSAL
ncbi:hypothetical protein PybrP1_009913 [[Pythium] brassicae (nom. inval.)]|nr:hypothetical protein PybrP1_009913 [[Pythium] brassicae (nom. inval.)]